MSPPVCAHAPEPEMRLMAADMQVGAFSAGVPPQVPGTLEPCRSASIWAARCALRSETPKYVRLVAFGAQVTSTAGPSNRAFGGLRASQLSVCQP